MRFTSRKCYHLRGGLLHRLFTLTRLAAGGTISVALSVEKRGYAEKTAAACFRPVITRHFFRRSPDFFLIICLYHQKQTKRLYPICYPLIILNQKDPRQNLPHHPFHHQEVHHRHPTNLLHRHTFLTLPDFRYPSPRLHPQIHRQDQRGFRLC